MKNPRDRHIVEIEGSNYQTDAHMVEAAIPFSVQQGIVDLLASGIDPDVLAAKIKARKPAFPPNPPQMYRRY
ncbi:hypothetical protein HW132_31955 [Brasilonema sp. CT11]|nr:hypothetical protein [Brasilonema sp. CT11]